jgi:Zn-dependent protease/predicted transcriptional regulator
MRSSIRLGRVFGIEIGLHYSWFLIALLIVMSLSSQFQASHAEWGLYVIWALSILTAILFFVALLAHEMSHALVARARGLNTKAITLFALGGVAQIEKEPEDAKTEFLVGIVGPLSSAVIGLVSIGIAWAVGWRIGATPETPLLAMFVWLGYINLSLAAFNMIPGYPLDGGRILRSILWMFSHDVVRATKMASNVGKVIALLFIAFGIFGFFHPVFGPFWIYFSGLGGLWMAFIGWFLLQAATASATSVTITAGLKGIQVSDVMTSDCVTLDGNMNVEQFVEAYLLRSGKRCFVVQQNGEMAGLVTAHEIKELDRARWPYTTLSDIMRPLDELHTVAPSTSVMEALETMGRDDVNQLPVVSGSHLDGIITRANVVQFLHTRAELGQ